MLVADRRCIRRRVHDLGARDAPSGDRVAGQRRPADDDRRHDAAVLPTAESLLHRAGRARSVARDLVPDVARRQWRGADARAQQPSGARASVPSGRPPSPPLRVGAERLVADRAHDRTHGGGRADDGTAGATRTPDATVALCTASSVRRPARACAFPAAAVCTAADTPERAQGVRAPGGGRRAQGRRACTDAAGAGRPGVGLYAGQQPLRAQRAAAHHGHTRELHVVDALADAAHARHAREAGGALLAADRHADHAAATAAVEHPDQVAAAVRLGAAVL